MNELVNKSVIICDYPSKYLFPPLGYGGIERWLWTVAIESLRLGMEVILVGPQWRHDLLPGAKYIAESILNISPKVFLESFKKADFLVGGHEYWLNDTMLNKFNLIAKRAITYQHGSSLSYRKNTFDNKNNFLYCYSNEMMDLYKEQSPSKLLCVASGFEEDPIKQQPENYLITIGRIDEDKSQHYAILAARKMNLPIYILGEDVRHDGYIERHEKEFYSHGVEMKGVVWGKEKTELIARAKCGIYTLGRYYVEPAAGTIAEIIRSGVPLVGMSWKGNDAICEPIRHDLDLGVISQCSVDDTEEVVVNELVQAITKALNLDRDYIYNKGNELYNPTELVRKMYTQTLE